MKKKPVLLAVFCLTAALLAGCGAKKQETKEQETKAQETKEQAAEPIRVGALEGPTAMGMAHLLDKEEYQFTIAASPDEIMPLMVQGKLDIAAVPANLAAVLHQKTDQKIQVMAVNTLGVLYLVENGDTIHTAEDLRGKTIYASGKGATPEYALNVILKANGMTPGKDVTVEYKTEHAEVLSALAADAAAVGMLPQPFVTIALMKNEGLRIALDLNELWESSHQGGGRLVTGVVIGRTEFLEENKIATGEFLDAYKESVSFVNQQPEDAAKIIGDHGIVEEKVAAKAIPQCSITFVEGKEMKAMLSGYLDTLLEQNPEIIGGTLPDEGFYYER